jgi:hypothetical protein
MVRILQQQQMRTRRLRPINTPHNNGTSERKGWKYQGETPE